MCVCLHYSADNHDQSDDSVAPLRESCEEPRDTLLLTACAIHQIAQNFAGEFAAPACYRLARSYLISPTKNTGLVTAVDTALLKNTNYVGLHYFGTFTCA